MKTIERIVFLTGGLMLLGNRPLLIKKPPFLPLRVRHLGIGPRDFACVAVAQMIPREEEQLVESETIFEIDFCDEVNWLWLPVCFRQESPSMCQLAVTLGRDGALLIDRDMEAGIGVIAQAWEEILVSRGYGTMDITP